MIAAVFDTNILISSIFWRGPPYKLMQEVIRGRILHFTSPFILAEVRKVLEEDFSLPTEKIDEHIEVILSNSILLTPEKSISAILEDDSDNRILECAVSGQVDIVSGDKHLLKLKKHETTKIVTASEMLKILP
ncbi:MAG: putative toxin-antitoxin system toxin component, PIN family [Candidatus Hydrothermarchaeales archaeon]